jgi:hypothetical protein
MVTVELWMLEEANRAVEKVKVKLRAAEFVLSERERELLELKGPCSLSICRLHFAHSGPCDE